MESYVKGKMPQIIFGSKSAQKVSGLLKKYEIKKCLLVTGHHVVRHSITQNVIKALSVEGIHCDVFDRVTPEPTDTLCQELGLDTLQKIFAEKGYCDNCQEFTEKMIPLVMDDFKSREWMPPIHTGNYKEKIGKICEAIYAEK